jgi:hypothetical protein
LHKAREGEHLKERNGMRVTGQEYEKPLEKKKTHTKEKAENCLVKFSPPSSASFYLQCTPLQTEKPGVRGGI